MASVEGGGRDSMFHGGRRVGLQLTSIAEQQLEERKEEKQSLLFLPAIRLS